MAPCSSSLLPAGIHSRFVDNGNGLHMHVLEAGFESGDRPSVVLLHGFPELAYCWRKVMPLLAPPGHPSVRIALRTLLEVSFKTGRRLRPESGRLGSIPVSSHLVR